MKFKIEWLEKKTTNSGKPMLKVTLTPYGTEEVVVNPITDVAIWSGFLNFSELKAGDIVEGELETKQNGQYVNKTLKSPSTGTSPYLGANRGQSGAFKSKQITEAMETKAHNIAQAQDRSAWMWAKNNAGMLLANNPKFYESIHPEALRGQKPKEYIAEAVIALATLIYNGEPIEPFTSNPKEVDPDIEYEGY